VAVRVPDGCLFLQAGRQLEWLTGGHVVAGMHEVLWLPLEPRAAYVAGRYLTVYHAVTLSVPACLKLCNSAVRARRSLL